MRDVHLAARLHQQQLHRRAAARLRQPPRARARRQRHLLRTGAPESALLSRRLHTVLQEPHGTPQPCTCNLALGASGRWSGAHTGAAPPIGTRTWKLDLVLGFLRAGRTCRRSGSRLALRRGAPRGLAPGLWMAQGPPPSASSPSPSRSPGAPSPPPLPWSRTRSASSGMAGRVSAAHCVVHGDSGALK